MAENESLDLGGSHRWRNVLQAVKRGDSVDAVALLMQDSLYRTLRKVQEQIPFGRLMAAALSQPNELPAIICECEGHDYACLFTEVAEPPLREPGERPTRGRAVWPASRGLT